MSLLWFTKLNNEYLNASDPQAGIPFLNLFYIFLTALSFSFLDNIEFFILSTNTSNSQPFMIYNGSITLPNDLDIFLPSSSLTMLCSITSVNGSLSVNIRLIITILATQKNKIS